jgi:hypothetical protein
VLGNAVVWDIRLCGTGASGKNSRLPDAARPIRPRVSHVRVANVQSDVLWLGGGLRTQHGQLIACTLP